VRGCNVETNSKPILQVVVLPFPGLGLFIPHSDPATTVVPVVQTFRFAFLSGAR
jgi:hypothetical protein